MIALVAGAPALGYAGVSAPVAACMVAAGAVWGSALLATAPFVVRRVPNIRGAIMVTGVMAALALSFFAYNAWHPGAHAHAMESTVSSP